MVRHWVLVPAFGGSNPSSPAMIVTYTTENSTYLLDSDIELALKNTPDWGDHFEIEYIGDTSNKTSEEVLYLLEEACTQLGITPMTPSEIEAFIAQINQRL